MPDYFDDSFGSLEGSLDVQTPITKDEPLDYDDFGTLDMMSGSITPASTAPSDLIIGTPCGGSPTPSCSSNSASSTPSPSNADPLKTDGEKKPVKKRKSWGQVLPTPTTNLPPRKRAKTEPEKEQRRIERVIRNRQAAQTSRERKRLEYEALEKAKSALEVDNVELKTRLTSTERENIELAQRLQSLEQQLKTFQDTIRVAQEIAQTAQSSSQTQPLPSPAASDDVPSRISYVDATLDPNTLFSGDANNNSSSSLDIANVEALFKTQQTAVLLCDLPCLQRASRPSAELLTIWMMQYLLLATITSTISSIQMPFLQLFLSLKRGNKIPDSQLARFSPLILWLIMTKPTKQLWRRLLTCNPACALLSLVATDERMLSESSRLRLLRKLGSFSIEGGGGLGGLDNNPASELRRLVEQLGLGDGCSGEDYGPVKRSGSWNIPRRPPTPGCGRSI
jgi:transcriptional activator HAC1